MTDLLQDIISYLNANGFTGTVYRDTMPDSPDTLAALYEYPGNSPIPQIAGADRSVQIVTRDISATSSKEACRQIYHILDSTDTGIVNFTAERWAIISIKQSPFKMKVDDKQRVYYCFNMTVTTYTD